MQTSSLLSMINKYVKAYLINNFINYLIQVISKRFSEIAVELKNVVPSANTSHILNPLAAPAQTTLSVPKELPPSGRANLNVVRTSGPTLLHNM